jgi:drug/metabolite transporter (DMT)-like permease
MPGRSFDFAVLALGVVAVSTAAIFIRQADAPALVISALRLSVASVPLLLFAGLRRNRLLPRQRNQALLFLLSGVLLALHLAFWVASVQQTSVMTSVVLVTAAPLFVAVASGPVLKEKPGGAIWLGLAIAAAGAMVMVAEDIGAGGDTLRGDLFALLGAVFAAAYFLVGRYLLSSGTGWLPYITVSYSTSAVVLVLLAVIAGNAFTGHSNEAYLYILLLALVPQLIGHTAVNRSLGHLPAIAVALAVQGEPVGATILAAIFLDEVPTLWGLAGAFLVLTGVYIGLRQYPRARATAVSNPGEEESRPA